MSDYEPSLPPDSAMPELRARLDMLDAKLVPEHDQVAANRQLVRIKAREHLPARISSRVEEVAANARRLAEVQGLDPDLAERLWRLMMDHFIAQEDRFLANDLQG